MAQQTSANVFAATDIAIGSGVGSAEVTTTTGAVVAAQDNRTELTIINDSDTVIYLGLGVAAQANKGIRLAASGGSWTTNAWQGTVNAIHAGAGTKVLCYVDL